MKKLGIYDPYLDVLGGGEKHILSIAQIIEKHDYDLHFFWDENLTHMITEKLHITFQKNPTFLPNIFKHNDSTIAKTNFLAQFDIFLYVTDGSYFFSRAGHNYVFCMVPNKKLYNRNFINRFKMWGYTFICNSLFTKNKLEEWGINSHVIYPYIDKQFFDSDTTKKEKIILSVGRFFQHLHAKRQDIMIDFFKKLRAHNKKFSEFKLILAGGLKDEDMNYFNNLKKMVGDDTSIVLKPNVTYKELLKLYSKSMLYWHFTGYGIDENKEPEKVEHLGITPLEAMATGCITFCVRSGGPKEIIEDGINGFLFSNESELTEKMNELLDNDMLKSIKDNGKIYVLNNFSYEIFEKNVTKIMRLSNT